MTFLYLYVENQPVPGLIWIKASVRTSTFNGPGRLAVGG